MMSSFAPPDSPPPPPPLFVDVTVSNVSEFFTLLASNSKKGQFITIELSVLLASVFLVMLFIHGGMRRRLTTPGWIISTMRGVHIVTPVLITYIIGLMHNAIDQNKLFPVWALVLIYFYGGVDTLTANDLRDSNKVLQYSLHVLPLFFWALWLGQFFTSGIDFAIPITVLFVLAVWNAKETIQALCQSNQNNGLPAFISHMVDYIRDNKATRNENMQHGSSMSRYTFFVKRESGSPSATTTQDVWECTGDFLQDSITNHDRSQHLKDIVLSYALGLLLLRRFARFPLDEASSPDMLSFVRDTLLKSSSDPHLVSRLFRIIEVELSFVFDFFYTKLCIISSRRSHYKLRRLLCVPFFIYFGFKTLQNDHKDPIFDYTGRGREIYITRTVLFIIAAVEVWQISTYFLSYWRILFLVCDYVHGRKKQAQSKKATTSKRYKASELRLRIREMGLICTWAIKVFVFNRCHIGFFLKPWKRAIGQYSFLENYHKVPMLHYIVKKTVYHFIEIPRIGQGKISTVALSEDVKSQIVSSLLKLTGAVQETNAINKQPVVRETSKSETTAETLLIWHIATSALEYSCKPVEAETKHFTIATQISKYCAYLVTFTPDLLPDYPYNKFVFDKAVVDAKTFLGEPGINVPYKKLLEEPASNEQDAIVARNIVQQGAVLATKLQSEVMRDDEGWKMLASKWAELLLYASLSDNAIEHGVRLAKGGELITHLWALLTHAGVVTPQDLTAAAATL